MLYLVSRVYFIHNRYALILFEGWAALNVEKTTWYEDIFHCFGIIDIQSH